MASARNPLSLANAIAMQHRSSLLAATIVAGLVAAGLFALRSRPADVDSPAGVAPGDSVERCLERMLDAARRGDVEAYVECFAGDMRPTFAERLARDGRTELSAGLRTAEADLKSFVTRDPSFPQPDRAVVVLERIYSSRNELHRLTLQRVDDTWRIIDMTPLERVAPEIPYGTPVVPDSE